MRVERRSQATNHAHWLSPKRAVSITLCLSQYSTKCGAQQAILTGLHFTSQVTCHNRQTSSLPFLGLNKTHRSNILLVSGRNAFIKPQSGPRPLPKHNPITPQSSNNTGTGETKTNTVVYNSTSTREIVSHTRANNYAHLSDRVHGTGRVQF